MERSKTETCRSANGIGKEKLAVTLSHAILPSEKYWEVILPNTPMPNAIRQLLGPDAQGKVNTPKSEGNIKAAKGGVSNNNDPCANLQENDIGPSFLVFYQIYFSANLQKNDNEASDKLLPYNHDPVNLPENKDDISGNLIYTECASDYNTTHGDNLQVDPKLALFFLEKDLHKSTKMNLQFVKFTVGATFLPYRTAQAIPFTTNKLPQVLKHFSIDPKSLLAKAMKKTVQMCEAPANKGEERYCAKSLESMIDFSTSKLGEKIQVISTEVDQEDLQRQKYSFEDIQKIDGYSSVVCHTQMYAYVVFYCHFVHNTKAYSISLVSEEGKKVKAAALCHMNTSSWDPNHLALQILKVKPGEIPVCHFLPEYHVVWVSN